MIVPSSRLSPSSTPPSSLSASIRPLFRVHVFHQNSSTVPPPKLPPLLLNFEDCLKNAAESLKVGGRELLHHYTTTTSVTLATGQPAQIVWQEAIPQLAASHRFLVHGILAITSLHMARLRGDAEDKETLIATAASQLNIALSLFRHVITNVTAENCEALFAFSYLVCVFIFNISHEECQAVLAPKRNAECAGRKTQAAEMTRIAVGMFRTQRGSLVILFPGWDWLSRGPLSPLCTREWWPKTPIPVDAEAVLEDCRLAALERLWMQPGKDYEYAFQVLASALTQLRNTFALVSQLTRNPSSLDPNYRNVYDQCDNGKLVDCAAIFTWPARVSEEFIALIENQRPEALTILAHYAILPGRIRGVWWIEGWGMNLVTTAALVLGEERKSWIEWPIRVVGLEWESILG